MKATTNPCTKCRDNFPMPVAMDYFDERVIADYVQRRSACTAVADGEKPCLKPAPAKRPVLRICVIYVKDGIEQQSPWFTCRARAEQAKAIIQKRYGACVLYVD